MLHVTAVVLAQSLELDTNVANAKTLTSVKFVKKDWVTNTHLLRFKSQKTHLLSLEPVLMKMLSLHKTQMNLHSPKDNNATGDNFSVKTKTGDNSWEAEEVAIEEEEAEVHGSTWLTISLT